MRKTKLRWLLLMLVANCTMATAFAYAGHPGHEEHASKHGGKVTPIDAVDHHAEIVVKPNHEYNIFFSNSSQVDMPAAKFANVALIFSKPGAPPQTLTLQLSDDGEYWTGTGGPQTTSAQTIVKLDCSYMGTAISKNIPLFAAASADHHAQSK